MPTNNVINNTSVAEAFAASALTVDPGASGDSYVQFDINTTGEWRFGSDDTASGALKLSNGSALGTTDTFIMTTAGERTMPLQPAVFAIPSGVQSNVTGDGTIYTVLFQTETEDQGGDFAGGTGIFTAPVTGKYHFIVSLSFTGITASHNNCPIYFGLNGTGTTNIYDQNTFATGVDVAGAYTISGEAIVSLTASDTYRAIARFLSGTKVVDITTSSYFGCYLIG